MCWHNYEYIGEVVAHRWLAGVSGGIPVEVIVKAKRCMKCGKTKEGDR